MPLLGRSIVPEKGGRGRVYARSRPMRVSSLGNLPAGNLCDGGGHVYRRVAACLQGKAAHVVAAMLADEAEGVLG